MLKQQVYLRNIFVSYPDKCIGATSKRLLKIPKDYERILQSLSSKDHSLRWVTTQIVLPRILTRLGLPILMVKVNPSTINHEIL